ncbi:MAG: VPLPA-CTERM sorting domain-containing protein [Pseudomonadota bacterium]
MTLKSTVCAAIICAVPMGANAASIDVLWTSGSAAYNNNITELAGEASAFDPAGDGNLDWNLTFWDASTGAAPVGGFGNYDVMVIGSTCNFAAGGNCSGSGFFNNGVFVDGITSLESEIEAARGTRTFLSGQDADWHDLNNRQDQPDGPAGFMINAVNWAASGSGLGVVSMTDRINNNDGWWTAAGSFLADEIPSGDAFSFASEIVNIGPGQDAFPINEGLTSAGLSNWNTSSHACFNEVDGYTAINLAPQFGGTCGVTIVTSAFVDGGTDGGDDDPVDPIDPVTPVPLPASGLLMLTAFGLVGAMRRRNRA